MGCYRCWLDTPEAMASFREAYRIPDNVLTRLNDPDDFRDGMSARGDWVPFPLIAIIEGGVRFPIHPLLRACLSSWHLAPCQLLPNAYKIIMGTAELNRLLGINLGVHDIEEAYYVCKSVGESECYYLRVKPKQDPFVHKLEDSYKYAEDDRLFVSGEWEFGANSDRSFSVPRHFGIPPSKFQIPLRFPPPSPFGWG